MKSTQQPIQKVLTQYNFRKARQITGQFTDIDVIVGSDETVFNEVYVTGIIDSKRVCRFKKSTLTFV